MSHSVRHFAGDLYANAGIWSPPSSAANFCEEDYAVTIYIAEFINSLSNLAYIYYAIQHYSKTRSVDVMSASLFLVGVCSFIFHASLRQTMQFGDDLSMLFLAGSLIQRLYCAGQPQASTRRLITTAVYAAVCLMSAYYVQSGNIVVHTSMFAVMLTFVWPRTLYLINRCQAQSPQQKEQERARLRWKFRKAGIALAIGFLVWNIDLEACQFLRNLRNAIGLPWAWLLELHGWWHFFTALGAAIYMDLIRELCP